MAEAHDGVSGGIPKVGWPATQAAIGLGKPPAANQRHKNVGLSGTLRQDRRNSLESKGRDRYPAVVAVEPPGWAQVHVTHGTGTNGFDLRFYGSSEYPMPPWWIGISDSSGDLLRTEVLPIPRGWGGNLSRWLKPIVGSRIADRVVNLILKGRRGRPQDRRPRRSFMFDMNQLEH